MQDVIREYLEGAKFGRKQVYKNMAVFPLLSESSLSLDYMLLDEALGAGLVEVSEVDNHGAVPNLKVSNKSPKMVLILDGEELVGAKQNRIVNTTILVAGNATVVIPVSCVEQGRWAYNTPTIPQRGADYAFTDAGHESPAGPRIGQISWGITGRPVSYLG